MRNKLVIRVLLIVSVLNLLSFSIKLGLGIYASSNAVIADAYHSLSDLLANFVGIIAINLSFKPADHVRSYGYEKIENLASIIISFVLFFTGGRVILNAIESFSKPSDVNINLISIVIMASTLIINITVVLYEKYQGKKLKSSFLITDATHTLSDIYITFGVIANMIVISLGFPIIIDTIISVVIGFIIIKAGLKVFLKATAVLIDSSIIDVEELEKIIYSFDEVKEAHYIKNRGNEITLYVEGHIMLDHNMSVYDAHELIERIEEKISSTYEYNFRFNFHTEPYIDKYKVK